MSVSYFSAFSKLRYNGTVVTDITARVAFIDRLKELSSVYYPFVIEDGDTADNIAHKYYGNSSFDWLVYLANNIIDPYTQWPKSTSEFDNYIIKKYGSSELAKTTILFYRKKPEISYISIDGVTFTDVNNNSGLYTEVQTYDDIRITPETYATINDPMDYTAIDAYSYELEENENKRHIILIDDTLANKIYSELKDLLHG